VPFNSIDELNEAFYSDRNQRQFHLPKAKQLYDSMVTQLGFSPKRVLSLGKSWLSEHLTAAGINVLFPHQIKNSEGFDIILAMDEILTREKTEADQKKLIGQIMQLTSPGGYLVASLRDYRNTNCHRRPLGDSTYNRLGEDDVVTVEVNGLEFKDKQEWQQKIHVVVNDSQFTCLDLGPRRTLYFKQMAKYCSDAGASDFSVSKDLHWRNHLRRIPEHVAFARKQA
jgi:hypothetical protein